MEKMSKNKRIELIKFFKISGQLKNIPRAGWLRVGIKSPESVADHTFRTALLCMIFSSLERLDALKMVQMALIHDLPEVVVGDLTPLEKAALNRDREENAMKSLLSSLPKEVQSRHMQIWQEYASNETIEAKTVRQLEKLEMALQAREYEESGIDREILKEFIKSADESILSPAIRALFSCIYPSAIMKNGDEEKSNLVFPAT